MKQDITISRILLNKWMLIAGLIAILYFTGGFDIITNNPALIIFGIVVIVVLNVFGGKK